MIREKRCSAQEALAAHLAAVDRRNPAINALITLDRQRATDRAREADQALARGELWGPLHGLPMTVKDGYDTAGLRTTYALPMFRNYTPARDAQVVTRLKRAGAVIFGKSNLPLASFDWQCHHPNYGRAKNPWDLSKTPGGSSGGAAAALAAGLTPLEMGSDVAGSLRVPAHFCGVTTLRPTEGWVSDFGAHQPPGWPRLSNHLISFGPMARSVADLALAMSVVAGPGPERWELPRRDWREDPTDGLAGLRLAYWESPCGARVGAETRRAFRGFLDKLADAGCRLTQAEPYDLGEAYKIWSQVEGFLINAGMPAVARLAPPLFWPLVSLAARPIAGADEFVHGLIHGFGLSRRGYFAALERRARIAQNLDAFFQEHDLFLSPVSATPAFSHRRPGRKIDVDGDKVLYGRAMGPFNCPTAAGGNPIAVIPIAKSEAGLPIGVQIGAARWRDPRLLSIAAHMETLADAQCGLARNFIASERPGGDHVKAR